jgi:hypothetical protein
MYAKQNTAKTFLVGPILDADGAAKTDEVIGSIKVTKNGTVGDPNASSTLTHNHTGHYTYVADAGDFDTLGEVEFSLNSGTNAMAPVRFMVVPANVYDAMVSGTDNLEVDTTQWDGSTVPVFPANFASLGINASGHVSRVTLVDTCTANTDMRGTDGAYTGTPPSVEQIQSGLATLANQLTVLERLTAARAEYLDKLNVAGDLANTANASSFKATGFAVPGSPMTLTSGERNAVADAVLSRDVANAESSAAEHSLCTIVLASLESSISGTTWTIKRTDGVTTHAIKTLTTDETADPITGVS